MEEIPAACEHDQCSLRGATRESSTWAALQGHPAQQRDLPPAVPQTGMNTRLLPHIPDLEMLVGKLGEEPLPEGFLTVPPVGGAPITPHSIQWEKEVEA